MFLLSSLGSSPRTISSLDSVVDAAQAMADHHVGSLVVLCDEQPHGMVTDRDLALACLQHSGEYSRLAVGDCVSTPLHSIPQDCGVAEATAAMGRHGIRRVGLTGPEGELVGVLSMDDLIRHLGLLGRSMNDTVNREFREERSPSAPSGSRFGLE